MIELETDVPCPALYFSSKVLSFLKIFLVFNQRNEVKVLEKVIQDLFTLDEKDRVWSHNNWAAIPGSV